MRVVVWCCVVKCCDVVRFGMYHIMEWAFYGMLRRSEVAKRGGPGADLRFQLGGASAHNEGEGAFIDLGLGPRAMTPQTRCPSRRCTDPLIGLNLVV